MLGESSSLIRILALLSLAAAAFGIYRYGEFMRQQPPRPTLQVAAAADLQGVFDELRDAFRQAHPGIEVQVTFGSSGSLFAQLSNRAPFDVFMSADADYPRKLCEAGFAKVENCFPYAVGHLVVWVRNESPLALEPNGIHALLVPNVRKVAIANPQSAPYGRAARAALEKLSVYEQLRDKLVLGNNVAQTAQFVQAGAADAGVLSLSLALSPALREQGRYWKVPPDLHPRLEQVGAIMNEAQDPAAARAWREFVLGPAARAVFQRYGFTFDY